MSEVKRFQLIRFSYLNDYMEECRAYVICELYSLDYIIDDKNFFQRFEDRSRVDRSIEMKSSVEIEFDESDFETIKRLYETNEKGRKSRGVYYREQHYGGAEEGGWYYHTLELQYYLEDEEETPKLVEEGTDAYGEGYVIWADFYIRENENLEKKFYC